MDLHELDILSLGKDSNKAIDHFANIRQCKNATDRNNQLDHISLGEDKMKLEKKQLQQERKK